MPLHQLIPLHQLFEKSLSHRRISSRTPLSLLATYMHITPFPQSLSSCPACAFPHRPRIPARLQVLVPCLRATPNSRLLLAPIPLTFPVCSSRLPRAPPNMALQHVPPSMAIPPTD